jgi:hypothetical protein
VLHAFEGKTPFGSTSRAKIVELRKVYNLDLDAAARHRLVERREAEGAALTRKGPGSKPVTKSGS